jgi:hypothetical protein
MGVAMIGSDVQPLQEVAGALTTTLSCTVLPCVFYLVLAIRAQKKLAAGIENGAIASNDVENGTAGPQEGVSKTSIVTGAEVTMIVDPLPDESSQLFIEEAVSKPASVENSTNSDEIGGWLDADGDEFEEPDLTLEGVHKNISWYVWLFCILAFVMGTFMATVGMYYAMDDLINAWFKPAKNYSDDICIFDQDASLTSNVQRY